MRVAIAKDSDGRIMIRAYRTPAQLARWASGAIFLGAKLEIVKDDAKLADLQPYSEVNFTGAAFTERGVFVAIIGNNRDVHQVTS